MKELRIVNVNQLYQFCLQANRIHTDDNKTYKNSNTTTSKYLGMNLDVKLGWKDHIKTKIKVLDMKYKKYIG